MGTKDQARNELETLLRSQTLAVLATHCEGRPHASLVGFAASEDLKHLVFATPKSTRKYANILADNRVAMLIDSRSNSVSDFEQAAAVTVTGRAREQERKASGRFAEFFLAKHEHLSEFVASPTAALIIVDVDRYSLVTEFQNVVEFRI